MAIDVVADGLHGKIVFVDQDESGSEILLVCERWYREGGDPIGTVEPTVASPPPDEPPDSKGGGIVPLGLAARLAEPKGTLALDVTALGKGLHVFMSEALCRSALTILSQGEQEVALTREGARELGHCATLGEGEAVPA